VLDQPSRELLISSHGSLYPRADNKLLLGATMEDVGYDKRVKLDAVQTLVRQGITLVPRLKYANLVGRGRVSVRSRTTTSLSRAGAGLDGAFVATGHYRSGFCSRPHRSAAQGDDLEAAFDAAVGGLPDVTSVEADPGGLMTRSACPRRVFVAIFALGLLPAPLGSHARVVS